VALPLRRMYTTDGNEPYVFAKRTATGYKKRNHVYGTKTKQPVLTAYGSSNTRDLILKILSPYRKRARLIAKYARPLRARAGCVFVSTFLIPFPGREAGIVLFPGVGMDRVWWIPIQRDTYT